MTEFVLAAPYGAALAIQYDSTTMRWTITGPGPGDSVEAPPGTTSVAFDDDVVARLVLPGDPVQAAIDAAQDGDVVVLAAGSYAESIVVPAGKDNLTVRGANAGIGNGESRGPESVLVGNHTLAGDGASLDGVRVEYASGVGVNVLGDSASVLHTAVHRTGTAATLSIAMQLNGADGAVVDDNRFTQAATALGSLFNDTGQRGVWSNNTPSESFTISDNVQIGGRTFANVEAVGATQTIEGNDATHTGTFVAIGSATPGLDLTGRIAGNAYEQLGVVDFGPADYTGPIGTFLNLRNVTGGVSFDVAQEGNTVTTSAATPAFTQIQGSRGGSDLTGGADADVLTTSDLGSLVDRFAGGAGDDTMSTGAGDDILVPGSGDDSADGGAGIDVAVFAGDFEGYAIDLAAGTVTDTDATDGDEGTATLTGIEILRFGDGDVIVVDDDPSAIGFGSVQDAIFAAHGPGTRILVLPGTYDEALPANDPDALAPNTPLGLWVPGDKDGLTIEGVDASLEAVTDVEDLQATIRLLPGTESIWGTSVYVQGEDTMFRSIAIEVSGQYDAGSDAYYVNKAIEVVADGFALLGSTVGPTGDQLRPNETGPVNVFMGSAVYLGDETSSAYDPLDPDAFVSTIGSFAVSSNALAGDVVVTNGAGFNRNDGTRLIALNRFFTPDGDETSYPSWGLILNGYLPVIPWMLAPIGDVTALDNEFATDLELIARWRSEDGGTTPTLAELLDFLNLNVAPAYAYALTPGGQLRIAQQAITLNGTATAETFLLPVRPETYNAYAEAAGLVAGDTVVTRVLAAGDTWTVRTEDLRVRPETGGGLLTVTLDTGIVGFTYLSTRAANATGNAIGNALAGNEGANLLQGLGGNDTLNGRGGNDTLLGGDNEDLLRPGLGNDTANGGAGTDTGSYSDLVAAVFVSLELAGAQNTGGAGIDILVSIENLTGGAGNDDLRGNSGANAIRGEGGNDTISALGGNDTLFGNDGNDLIRPGLGNDTADGGAGTDTLSLFDLAVAVSIDLASTGAQNTGAGGIKTIAGFENLTGGGAADSLRGTTGNNRILGSGGDDLIEGRAGNDELLGEAGNDVLRPNAGNDVVDGGAGTDTVSYAEYVSSGIAIDLAFSGAQNTGGAGSETLVSIEYATGGGGNDALRGNALVNVLTGGGGNDLLDGRAGNDVLTGGAGLDSASGGSGSDRFVYAVLSDAPRGSSRDTIVDFASGDLIDLETIDARTTNVGIEDDFAWIGSAGFSGVAGQLRYAGGIVQGDVNGDRVADLEIRIQNGAALSATSFDL